MSHIVRIIWTSRRKMEHREDTLSTSDKAAILDNEFEPSVDRGPVQRCESADEAYVSFIGTNSNSLLSAKTPEQKTTSDEKDNQTKESTTSRNYFYVEPLMFCIMFGMACSMICNKALLKTKACHNYLGYTMDICNNLTNHSDVLDDSQRVANNFNLYSTLIAMVPGAVISIFVGSWSDKYGRKLPIMIGLMGLGMQDALVLANAVYMQWPISYMLISSIPSGLVGSLIVINTCIYSYLSEHSQKKARTLRYAILELSLASAIPAGTFIAGQLFYYYGYVPVYSLSLCVRALSFLYVAFFMNDNKNTAGHEFIFLVKEFFRFESLRENLRTCLKAREHHGKPQIWMITLSMCIILLGYISMSEIAYFFCNKMYGWEPTAYSNVSAASSVVGIVVMVVTVPVLTKVLRVRDAFLGIIGSISLLGQSLARALAFHSWIYYIAIAIGCIGGLAPLAVRSRLSKIVDTDEIGKVFALLSSCESLVPIFGSLIATQVYNASVGSFPGLAFLCCAVVMCFPVVTFVVIQRWQNLTRQTTENVGDSKVNTSVQ